MDKNDHNFPGVIYPKMKKIAQIEFELAHSDFAVQPVSHDATGSSYHIYPTPPLGQDMTQGQFLSGV